MNKSEISMLMLQDIFDPPSDVYMYMEEYVRSSLRRATTSGSLMKEGV